MSAEDQARRWGGCGEVINVDAWCDADAVPSTAGLCDSPAKHREHATDPRRHTRTTTACNDTTDERNRP